MKNQLKYFFVLLFISVISLSGFSQGIINPVAGKWANKQVLVLDLQAGENAYYSLNGQNPEKTGFAYDGPVLLDMEGVVNLNVVIVKNGGKKYSESVTYSVIPGTLPENQKASSFIKKIEYVGIYDYSAGTDFEIPSSLEYSLGKTPDVFEQGKVLSVSSECVLSRFVPCTLSSGQDLWRFVIRIQPVISGSFSRKDVPFKITDWDTIEFTDLKQLYKIDDEYWRQIKSPVVLDRSENHMISWQNIDYSSENPVNFFDLPAKPELQIEKDEKGITRVKFQDGTPENFKLGIAPDNGSFGELYDVISIDTFQGDAYSGVVTLGIYYDSVYQGKIQVPYNVYKKIPQKPVFVSSSKTYVSRTPVSLRIESGNAEEIYYSVQGPVVLQNEDYSDSSNLILNLTDSSFKKYKKTITLDATMDGACLYKVQAYSVDKNKVKSRMAEYSVVIDQCNYFINPETDSDVCDGSEKNPFKTFQQCIPYINQTRFANVKIYGDVYLPSGNTTISSNCQITGTENSRLILPKNSNITIRNSTFALKNCLLIHNGFTNKTTTSWVFNVIYGVLDFADSEVVVPFQKSGMIVKAEKSVINMSQSGLNVTAQNYASVCASIDSKLFIKASRISGVAETAVLFSVQGGIFELSGSTCKVSGNLGRIAELFDSQSTIRNNSFNGELLKSSGTTKPVYTDSKNITLEDSNNQVNGF